MLKEDVEVLKLPAAFEIEFEAGGEASADGVCPKSEVDVVRVAVEVVCFDKDEFETLAGPADAESAELDGAPVTETDIEGPPIGGKEMLDAAVALTPAILEAGGTEDGE